MRLRHFPSTIQVKYVPTQSWAASHLQFSDGACDGFVPAPSRPCPGPTLRPGMGYWDERDLPFYHGLARTFPLATRWFCSCLGPTFPNRRFLIAGTANGLIDDLPFGMIDYPAKGTIFDLLTAHGISWVNYHEVSAPGSTWRRLSPRQGPGVAAAARRVRSPRSCLASAHVICPRSQVTADLYPLGRARVGPTMSGRCKDFFAGAQAGTLPAVSFVDPDFKYCSEENPQDIRLGEGFSEAVINAVMAGPAAGARRC